MLKQGSDEVDQSTTTTPSTEQAVSEEETSKPLEKSFSALQTPVFDKNHVPLIQAVGSPFDNSILSPLDNTVSQTVSQSAKPLN